MTEDKLETNSSVSTKAKTRKPPEFRHLPRDRARKLKQEWIQNKKIKTQWRHEKQRGNMQGKRLETMTQNLDAEGLDEPGPVASCSDIELNTVANGRNHANRTSFPAVRDKSHFLSVSQVATKTPLLLQRATTTRASHPHSGADKKLKAIETRKKELWTGRRTRPMTMRTKMGSLLEKIQNSLQSNDGTVA